MTENQTQNNEQPNQCFVCKEQINPGDKREPLVMGWGSRPVHPDCNHTSPNPRIADLEYLEEIRFVASGKTIEGVIAGSAPVIENDPVAGYGVNVEATKWDELPTDLVRVIHEKRPGGWADVVAWVNHLDTDEDGSLVDSWRRIGKVTELEILDDETTES